METEFHHFSNHYYTINNSDTNKTGSKFNVYNTELDFVSSSGIIDMLKAVNYTLSTNTDIIQAIPGFIDLVDEFSFSVNNFFESALTVKNTLIKLYLQISKPLKNYGILLNNAGLIETAITSDSTLRKVPAKVLLKKSKLLIKYATEYSHLLRNDGLSDYNVKAFLNIINEFETLSCFNFNITTRSKKLAPVHKIFDLLNDKIDKLVSHLKHTYPCFYNEYVKARKYFTPLSFSINN